MGASSILIFPPKSEFVFIQRIFGRICFSWNCLIGFTSLALSAQILWILRLHFSSFLSPYYPVSSAVSTSIHFRGLFLVSQYIKATKHEEIKNFNKLLWRKLPVDQKVWCRYGKIHRKNQSPWKYPQVSSFGYPIQHSIKLETSSKVDGSGSLWMRQQMLQVLKLSVYSPSQPFLLNCEFLQKRNHATIARHYNKCMSFPGPKRIQKENILLTSDWWCALYD